ncbi:MAG: ABC transporter permease [Nocardioidaceae bacterium]
MELVWRQFDYWVTVYRRTWRGSVVSSFLLPVLFLTAMGVGLGGFVDSQAHKTALGGLSYLDYIAPGLLASTAMQMAFGETTWPVMGAIRWHKTYFAQLATPLRPVDILNAHLIFVAFRIATSSLVFLLVIAAFGTVGSVAGGVAAFLVVVLLGMAHATPMFAISASLKTQSGFSIVYRLVVIPMSLFSGTFFPVSQLPAGISWIAYETPMWHGVELARMSTTGAVSWWPAVGHVAYLLAWLVVGWWFARRALHHRLVEKG